MRGVATLVGRLAHHNDVVYSLLLAFGALFSSSADKTVRRYALADRAPTLTWEAHSHSVTCLAASEPLGLLCSGAEDGRVCVWRVGETKAEAAGVLEDQAMAGTPRRVEAPEAPSRPVPTYKRGAKLRRSLTRKLVGSKKS